MDNNKVMFFEDLRDTLKWLLVGALIWEASKGKQVCPNQDALGMFTSFVQARALYEFFCEKKKDHKDDARAADFCDSWDPPESALYARYGKPLNKRVFHPVYGRSEEKSAGASGPCGPDHLNQQVIEFANELLQITKRFAQCVKPEYRHLVQSALQRALDDAYNAAGDLGIPTPGWLLMAG